MTRRAALYLRVSTDKQTVENQEIQLRQIAERRGWEVVEVYNDAGISGTKGRSDRPGLDQMLNDASRRHFDIVLVWAMNLLLAIMLLRQRMPDQAFAWSLRLGVVISSVGMAAAVFMVTPTPDQAAAIAGGYAPRIVGAHSVGVADGGPGLPSSDGARWEAT